RNGTARPQRGLVLLEDLADPRPAVDEFLHAREPGEERRNWFDRTVGYPRWAWLIARKRGAAIAPRPLPALRPGDAGEVVIELLPLRRGRLAFTAVTIARPDPLGLVNGLVRVPLPGSLVVLPKRYAMPDLALPGARKYQRGGIALISSVGDSEEFASLRDYRPGDPLRRIHWRSVARVGRPVVREYQGEFFVRHALVLDTFAGRPESHVFEEAVSVAASVACSIQTQDSLLDLLFVGPETYSFTAGRGLGHTDRLLEVLAGVGPCLDKPFRTLHHAVLERYASLSGCVAVLLAWDQPRRDFVRHLRALGAPTRAFVVSEPAALAAAAGGAPRRMPGIQHGGNGGPERVLLDAPEEGRGRTGGLVRRARPGVSLRGALHPLGERRQREDSRILREPLPARRVGALVSSLAPLLLPLVGHVARRGRRRGVRRTPRPPPRPAEARGSRLRVHLGPRPPGHRSLSLDHGDRPSRAAQAVRPDPPARGAGGGPGCADPAARGELQRLQVARVVRAGGRVHARPARSRWRNVEACARARSGDECRRLGVSQPRPGRAAPPRARDGDRRARGRPALE